MKKALYLIIALLIPVAIFFVGGLLLSNKYQFEETIVIERNRKEVFEQVNSLENWASWSAWSHSENPGLQVEYYGPRIGKGAGQKFMHKKGTGSIEITESKQEELVELKMVFGGAAPVYHDISFEENDGSVEITWDVHGEMHYGLAGGWLALLTPRSIRSQVGVSLHNLKFEMEQDKSEPNGN